MAEFRLLVCGGRDYIDRDAVEWKMNQLHAKRPITLVIHGAARGADTEGRFWADRHGIPTQAFPADWDRHGKAAGFIRNQEMLDEGKPHGVLAFPGGRGTDDMIRRARAAGLPVAEVSR